MQSVQKGEPLAATNLPAAQFAHAFVEDPVELKYLPAKQELQDVAPVDVWN